MTKKLLTITLLLGASLAFAQAPAGAPPTPAPAAAPAAVPITDADLKAVEAPKPEVRA